MYVAVFVHRTGGLLRTVSCEDKEEAFSICAYLAATMGHALSDEQREQLKTNSIVEFDDGACVQIDELEAFADVNKESLRAYEALLSQLRAKLEIMPSLDKAEEWLCTGKGRSLACEAGLGKYTPAIIVKMFPTATAKV